MDAEVSLFCFNGVSFFVLFISRYCAVVLSVFLFEMLWVTSRALYILGRCFTTELDPDPLSVAAEVEDRRTFWKIISRRYIVTSAPSLGTCAVVGSDVSTSRWGLLGFPRAWHCVSVPPGSAPTQFLTLPCAPSGPPGPAL